MRTGDEPFDRTGYETLDYMLVPERRRNSITNIESDINSGITSDHCPLWAKVAINLKAKYEREPKNWEYRIANAEQRRNYNGLLASNWTGGYEEMFMNMNKAAEEALPRIPKGKQRNQVTPTALRLIEQREQWKKWRAELREKWKTDGTPTLQEIDAIEKEIREAEEGFRWSQKEVKKQVRYDKRRRFLDMIAAELDEPDRWLGLKRLKGKYNPMPLTMNWNNKKTVSMNLRAEKAADHLELKQWGTAPQPTYRSKAPTGTHHDEDRAEQQTCPAYFPNTRCSRTSTEQDTDEDWDHSLLSFNHALFNAVPDATQEPLVTETSKMDSLRYKERDKWLLEEEDIGWDIDEEEADMETILTKWASRQYVTDEKEEHIPMEEITKNEVAYAIHKLKRNKAPGVDGVKMEFVKELDDAGREKVRSILNQFWKDEKVPGKIRRAKVALLHKKGDKADFGNYRPISRLTGIYKLYTAIIHERISEGIDHWLQQTQYGFRAGRGAAEAIQYVRRMIEAGGSRQDPVLLVLLDSEKAFDRIIHSKMLEALARSKIPDKYLRIIADLYDSPEFMVEIDGKQSTWRTKCTGIRQGGPFSPYLFIVTSTKKTSNKGRKAE